MAGLTRIFLLYRIRILSVAIGLLINGVVILALFQSQPPAPDVPRIVSVVLVTPDPVPEAEPEPEPEPEPVPEIEPPPERVPEPVRPVETERPVQAASAADAPVSARAVDQPPDSPASGERDVYAVSPGTRSVLSGLQCPGDPEGFARTGVCGEMARRTARIEVPAEDMMAGFDLSPGQIRALFGDNGAILAGEPTLDNPAARRNLSSADQMRDALPASRPDPAFGD